MCIHFSLADTLTTLEIEGDVYRDDAQVLQAIIQERVRSGSQTIHIHMQKVYYIDCESLFLLDQLRQSLATHQISLVFQHARDWCDRIFCPLHRCHQP